MAGRMDGFSLVVDIGNVTMRTGVIIDDLQASVREGDVIRSVTYDSITLRLMAVVVPVVILDIVSEGEWHRGLFF